MLTDISSWPVSLQLDGIKNTSPLECEKPLRNLPGKRLVCSGHWQKRPVVAKLFLDPRSAKRHWKREKNGVAALQKANITTPVLLFSGQLNDQTPVLVFEQLPEPKTALHIWHNLTDDSRRLKFLRQMLCELAAHHQAGLVQEDLHLSNFLYSRQRWYAIDGDAVDSKQAGMPLSLKNSLANLALFFAQLAPRFDHLIEPALAEYTRQRQLDPNTPQKPLLTKLSKVRKKRRLNYVKKSYRTCGEFVHQHCTRQVAIYRRNADPERICQLLADPDALLAAGEMLKDGNSATVVRVHHPQGDWVIKRYNIKNLWHALKRCLRPSRAWVSWGNTQRLNISGIATPKAIAVIEKRLGLLRLGAYYVCEHVAAPNAAEYFQNMAPEQSTTAQNFITLFDLLQRIGIHHGDCKATNFLIHNNQPWVIDLDAMREFRSRRNFLRHYHVDRKRFLYNWQQQPKLWQWFNNHLPR